ncbi:MAG: hypothetical protein Q4C12_00090 [Clostridia bacterium]|nr:hypothetical protein [Clostridia bacterium]
MNKQRRIRLGESCSLLEQALRIVTTVRDQEQDALDNFPENLQNSERCTTMEHAIDELEEAIENIEQAAESINNAY